MSTRRITIEVPEEVLLSEKTDEAGFGRELKMLAAVAPARWCSVAGLKAQAKFMPELVQNWRQRPRGLRRGRRWSRDAT